jgi:hypothetical protein
MEERWKSSRGVLVKRYPGCLVFSYATWSPGGAALEESSAHIDVGAASCFYEKAVLGGSSVTQCHALAWGRCNHSLGVGAYVAPLDRISPLSEKKVDAHLKNEIVQSSWVYRWS